MDERYETPEQWEKRTGEKVDDEARCWYKESRNYKLWSWTPGNVKEVMDVNENRKNDGFATCFVVLAITGKGAPPDDWRPE